VLLSWPTVLDGLLNVPISSSPSLALTGYASCPLWPFSSTSPKYLLFSYIGIAIDLCLLACHAMLVDKQLLMFWWNAVSSSSRSSSPGKVTQTINYDPRWLNIFMDAVHLPITFITIN
jgi:hypothetical protein